MILAIIRASLRWRLALWCLVGAGVLLSLWSIRRMPLDAIPDLSDPQLVVYAKWQRSPQLLESQLTGPIIQSLLGAPGVKGIRSVTHMGYSFIHVILESEARREPVRRNVAERIDKLKSRLPSDATVTLGADASSMGWIFQYAIVDREKTRDLRELRQLNEGRIKPSLQQVAGVAEVASVGGLEKQYQLRLFPPLLAATGISLKQIVATLQNAFQETGGRTVEVTNRDYQIRGVVDLASIDQIESMIVGHATDGAPVQLKDIGYIQIGYDQRRSVTDLNGDGEVAGGIVVMGQGQNVLRVRADIEQRLAQLKTALPPGIDIVTTYDRGALVAGTARHFLVTLVYELLVVVLVVALFLRNARSAVAPICVMLLGIVLTALPLSALNQTINLLSLAGLFIAIGEMVDATIVITENCAAELGTRSGLNAAERQELVVRSIASVARPLLFSMLIIVVSFLPLLFLGQREGRLFDPLVYSKTFAMAFSTLLTLFLIPSIVLWIFERQRVDADSSEPLYARGYRVLLGKALTYRYALLAASVLLLAAAVMTMFDLRKEFMPQMEEGSILYMPATLPGLPAKEAGWILQRLDKRLTRFPEVASVFGKMGRADTSTDTAPVSMVEATVLLKPQSEWRKGMTKKKLIAEMDDAMQVIGYVNTWVQPIGARIAMQSSGIQTAVGIKVKGPDLATIEKAGREIEGLLQLFPNTKSVIAERVSSGSFIDTRFDPVRMARHGISAEEAMLTVRYAIGGDNVVAIREGNDLQVPLSLQYAPEYIDTLVKIRRSPVMNSTGRNVAIEDIADVAVRKMPEMVRNDDGELTSYVFIDVGDFNPTEYVDKARPFLEKNLVLPPGAHLQWTGEHEDTARVLKQLALILPLTLALIFALLIAAFRSVLDSALIMLSVPFAFVGAVALQSVLGYPMTTAVIVGYVALFAVAVQTGIIMMIFIRQAVARRGAQESYMDAVVAGSVARLRPKLMTVACTALSLLPIMFIDGPGMEIMRPIAAPTVGGMLSSAIYVLFLIPCLCAVGQDLSRLRRKQAADGVRREHPPK